MPAATRLSDVTRVLDRAGLLVGRLGAGDPVLSGAVQDSRDPHVAGSVFLAWEGTAHDGHAFAEDAVAKGAVAVIGERPLGVVVPQVLVEDGRRAAALSADAVQGSPWHDLFLAGVTGTNGKTTTALLARWLLAGDRPAAALGTLGLVDATGAVRPGSQGLTTPGPVQVSRWLRALVDEGTRAVVMEASSHALEQRRVDGLRFDAAVFTNVSRDHLDYHRSFDEYLSAKSRLAELLKPDGRVVVNREDRAWDALAAGAGAGAGAGATASAPIGFGIDVDSDVRALGLHLDGRGARFRLDAFGSSADVTLPLLGRFNVENALAAASIALVAGIDLGSVAVALDRAPQVPGRLERVTDDPCPVVVDYAHTPDALERVLEVLRSLTSGRLSVVFGAGGDRDRAKRPLMGAAAARHADLIVITSDNPRSEDPASIIDQVATGVGARDHDRIVDRREAIEAALSRAGPDDLILVAGKGHEDTQVIGDQRIPFDDRTVVRELTRGRSGGRA